MDKDDQYRFVTTLTDEECARLAKIALAVTEEGRRLKALSNQELVKECLESDTPHSPIVEEMLDRLDPDWVNRDE